MATEEQQEQRKQILILGVLVVGLVGALYWFVLRGSPEDASIIAASEMAGAPGPANVQVASAAPVTASSNVSTVFVEADIEITRLIQDIKEVDFIYAEVHEARDPMNPLIGTGIVLHQAGGIAGEDGIGGENLLYFAESKRIQGIIWDSKNPLAVIDDEVVGVGYRLHEQIYVKDITESHVVLSVDVENEKIEIVKELREQ